MTSAYQIVPKQKCTATFTLPSTVAWITAVHWTSNSIGSHLGDLEADCSDCIDANAFWLIMRQSDAGRVLFLQSTMSKAATLFEEEQALQEDIPRVTVGRAEGYQSAAWHLPGSPDYQTRWPDRPDAAGCPMPSATGPHGQVSPAEQCQLTQVLSRHMLSFDSDQEALIDVFSVLYDKQKSTCDKGETPYARAVLCNSKGEQHAANCLQGLKIALPFDQQCGLHK